jgi:hypothetical protein
MQLRTLIKLHKALTAPVVSPLMFLYTNTTTAAWVYLALHGTYGLLWLIKDWLFPDQQRNRPVSWIEATLASWCSRPTGGALVADQLQPRGAPNPGLPQSPPRRLPLQPELRQGLRQPLLNRQVTQPNPSLASSAEPGSGSPPALLAGAIAMSLLGSFHHFGNEVQKHFTLAARPDPRWLLPLQPQPQLSP